jgi:membrane-associated phospholipid phosphatase
MHEEAAAAAWRLHVFNWLTLAGAGVALCVTLLFSDLTITAGSIWIGAGFVGIYGAFAWLNAKFRARKDPQVVFVLGGFAQIVLVTLIMTPFTYIAATANLPMQDQWLRSLDEALGLDWPAYVAFVHAHPVLATWIDFGYTMIKWPLFIIPVALAAGHRYLRLQQYTLAFLLALIVTTAISTFVPALGTYHEFGLSVRDFPHFNPGVYESQLIDLPLIRDGSMRALDLGAMTGIVTFPSFHAASAAIYLWALWPVKLLRPIAILANVAMIAATPAVGGHYFVDVVAGLALAAASIAVAGRICNVVSIRARRPAGVDALAVPAA